MTGHDGAGLRVDAARNRQRILDAARAAYAEHGLDVSMRQIALRAGVGEPTLRRRFPSKEALVAEAFQDKVALYADEAERALADADPWDGFVRFVRAIAGMQLTDQGFASVLTMTFPATMRAEAHRRRAYDAATMLIQRAQEAGALRRDFSPEDIVLILLAHAGVVSGSGTLASVLSDRLLEYFFEAFQGDGSRVLPDAPSAAATYRALLRLHRGSDPG